MSLQQAAAAALGGLATAMYLDARYLLRHDLHTGSAQRNALKATDFVTSEFTQGRGLMYHYFTSHAQHPHRSLNTFLIFEGREWTYAQFHAEVQRVGNWLLHDLGVQRDEMVAVDGPNSPEYVMLMLALNGIGAAAAYINSHLTATPMVHSVKLCGARYLLADHAVEGLVRPCEEELMQEGVRTVYYHDGFTSSLHDETPLPEELTQGLNPTGIARLIYTSGTTGLPKGVMLARARELAAAKGVSEYLALKPGVRMYTCLPLYHVSGHNLCCMPSVFAGSTVVLSRKFSHATFWPEVRASRAQIVQYVGELARYLLNAPPSPMDKEHDVRMIWGNGIRPDVWEPFRQRFGVETVNEIYGATDGFATCWNMNRGPFGRNAIAVRGKLWNWLNGAREKRVRIDVATEDVLRDPDTGFAVECKDGEAGECIHKVDPAVQGVAFAKYFNNSEAGLKRRLTDVFEKGDVWFRTGDMMKQDEEGRLFFVDRLGDTFRWHSENVSTNEVADVFGRHPQVAEANVYGVAVPHADGRAGCAAIVPADGSGELDMASLAQHALANLPRYAVPLFVRVVTAMDYTATNKMQKGRLKADGIDWERISEAKGSQEDKFYWLPPGEKKYLPYGMGEWERIKKGDVKL